MKKLPNSKNSDAADIGYMQRAIELAKQGRFTTAPNPNVGCVIVKDGNIVGEGFHLRAGEAHAEVHALAAAGNAAEGATCYVTLEPCSHYGRTPPCAEALVKAKVGRVVVAMVDPNPKVAGNGIAILTAAGINVSVGVLSEQAHALNPGFIFRMQHKRPFVRLKMAASLDGRTALANGESKWITGAAARADVQQFRAQANAILSTASTVLMDDAALNVRFSELAMNTVDYPLLPNGEPALRQPIRVVLDNRQRLNHELQTRLRLFQQPGPLMLVHGRQTEPKPTSGITVAADRATTPASVTTVEIDQDSHHNIDMSQLLQRLAELDINDIWVEAGATLAGTLLDLQLVDEIIIYLAPKLMGNSARGLAALSELTDMAQVPRLSFTDITQIGDDLRIIAKPEY